MNLRLQPNRERGFFATVIMVAILGLLLIYVAVNVKRLRQLDRELKLVEQRQAARLSGVAVSTNEPTALSP